MVNKRPEEWVRPVFKSDPCSQNETMVLIMSQPPDQSPFPPIKSALQPWCSPLSVLFVLVWFWSVPYQSYTMGFFQNWNLREQRLGISDSCHFGVLLRVSKGTGTPNPNVMDDYSPSVHFSSVQFSCSVLSYSL